MYYKQTVIEFTNSLQTRNALSKLSACTWRGGEREKGEGYLKHYNGAAAGKKLPEEVVLIVVLLLQSRLIPTLLPYLQYNHSHDLSTS